MRKNGLREINNHFRRQSKNGKNQLSQRIVNSIYWFGKACSGQSVGESFISLAIAAESLLGQGRTNNETLSLYIAHLVTGNPNLHISPIPQSVSKDFLKTISQSKNQKEKIASIYKRSKQLYEIRNKLVHGSAEIEAIDPIALIDFEALVRNSIFAAVSMRWKSENDFSRWARNIRAKNNLMGFADRLIPLGKNNKDS